MSHKESSIVSFEVPQIPVKPGIYTIFANGGKRSFPIYVGESTNVHRRIGEYIVSSFAAPTDFLVGEAIKHLQSKGFSIRVDALLFDGDDNSRRRKQDAIIREHKEAGFILLNRDSRQKGYNYKNATRSVELRRIIEFVDSNILSK